MLGRTTVIIEGYLGHWEVFIFLKCVYCLCWIIHVNCHVFCCRLVCVLWWIQSHSLCILLSTEICERPTCSLGVDWDAWGGTRVTWNYMQVEIAITTVYHYQLPPTWIIESSSLILIYAYWFLFLLDKDSVGTCESVCSCLFDSIPCWQKMLLGEVE